MAPRMGRRGPGFAASLLGLGLLAGGCDEEANYSYVRVKVTLAPEADADYLARITTCGVNVLDAGGMNILDFSPIGCAEGQVRSRELGTVDWSTVEGGQVRFMVTLKDRVGREMGKGLSEPITVIPKGTVEASLEVKRLPDPVLMPASDAGASDAGASDAGS